MIAVQQTSRSCAIARLCCLAIAVSFCCTIRSLLMANFNCTLIFACSCVRTIAARERGNGNKHTTTDDDGAIAGNLTRKA